MTANSEQAAGRADKTPARRAGTWTLGITLVVCGGAMLVSMFFPDAELVWLLKLCPLILVSLGAEVLLAARGGGKVKYDWAGMLLCFVLVCAALALYAVAWCLLYGREYGLFTDIHF